MYVQKINDTGFTGFEFKNTLAKRAFEEKLNKMQNDAAEKIRRYIEETSSEENKVIIYSTYSKMPETHEYALFAVFSNTDEIVNERILKSNSLKDFIKKCAAQAGYKPMRSI